MSSLLACRSGQTGDEGAEERYARLKGLTEDRWRDVQSDGMKVEDLYENATANTEAIVSRVPTDEDKKIVAPQDPDAPPDNDNTKSG